jgi:serine/threonine protein kinase
MRENANHEPDPEAPRPQAGPSARKVTGRGLRPGVERGPARDAAGSLPPAARKVSWKIDRYELFEMIGSGGMGAVYRAVDTKLGRTVALKTATATRNGARLTDRVRQRFLREAMALSKVEHRNVVQVLDFGFADDGTPFLVMEHLRGRDLGAVLAEAEGPLPVTDVVDIMLAVCAALRACHRAGIIHRDLKPGNIFLADTETGWDVKVLDFGVSKAPCADDLTREGQILGTPQYLAPEQIDGKVGPASDQYALGVVLYVCLTLRLPYEDHTNRQLLRAIETGTFEAPRKLRSELSEALEAIVLRAMHVSPSERFESVYALGQRLWELASPRSQEEWRSYYCPRSPGGRKAAGVIVARTEILDESPDCEDDGRVSFRLPTRAVPADAAIGLSPSYERWARQEARQEAQEDRSLEKLLRPWPRRGMAAAALALLVLVAVFAARLRASHRRAFIAQVAPVRPDVGTFEPRRAPPVPAVAPLGPLPAPGPPAVATSAVPNRSSNVPATPRVVTPIHAPRTRHRDRTPLSRTLPNIDQAGIGIPSE